MLLPPPRSASSGCTAGTFGLGVHPRGDSPLPLVGDWERGNPPPPGPRHYHSLLQMVPSLKRHAFPMEQPQYFSFLEYSYFKFYVG